MSEEFNNLNWGFNKLDGIKMISLKHFKDRTLFIGETLKELTLGKTKFKESKSIQIIKGEAQELVTNTIIPELTSYNIPSNIEHELLLKSGTLFVITFIPKLNNKQ